MTPKSEPAKPQPQPQPKPKPKSAAETQRSPGRFRRMRQAVWENVGPARRTRRAMSWFTALFALAVGAMIGGVHLRTGWGLWNDVGIGAGLALVVLLLTPLALSLVIWVVKVLKASFGAVGIAAFASILVLLDVGGVPGSLKYLVAGALFVLSSLLFGSLAVLTSGKFGASGGFKKMVTVLSAIVGIGGFAFGSWWLLHRGTATHLVRPVLAASHPMPEVFDLEDPGAAGTHTVQTLTYGSGKDRRPEFGEAAAIQTESVNAKPFMKDPSGWKGRLRKRYWGFDSGRLPLNGRVWYPKGDGPFPLVLVVHGNHLMTDFSDSGYAYLGEHLASRGMILVSVDENFLNSGGALFGGMSKENDARAWMLLKHLELWRKFHATEGSVFQGKVDMERIGLIGHSRGGEAVYHAALFNRLKHYPDDASVTFDFGFSIRGIISIAPTDGQYRPASRYAEVRDVNFFVIHGGHDSDVSSFVGERMYNRLKFESAGDRFKASLFVYRANHGQFNTSWGDSDRSPPTGLMLNRAALLSGEEQRKIAKVFFGAFFYVTLQDKRGYLGVFRDPRRARTWLPDTPMIHRFETPTFEPLADFEEDFDVTTIPGGGTVETDQLAVWREGDVKLRSGTRYNNGVFLGWDRAGGATGKDQAGKRRAPSYTLHLPQRDLGIDDDTSLILHLAAVKEKPKAKDYSVSDDEKTDEKTDETGDDDAKDDAQETAKDPDSPQQTPVYDLTVELTTTDGVTASLPLSKFGVLLPPLVSKYTRAGVTEGRYKSTEPNLQTFELPFVEFGKVRTGFDGKKLRTVRLVFDRTEKGVVVLDRVGLMSR